MQTVLDNNQESAQRPILAAADAQRWDLVRSLVHEMRSVLTAESIGAEMLASPRAEDAGFRRVYAEMISQQTARVAHLLEDFAELARPPASAARSGEEIADLNVALYAAGRELAGLASHLEQRLDLSPSPGAALIEGHQGRVTQALRGLLEYLLVSSPRGSRVVAELSLPADDTGAVNVALTRSLPADGAVPEPGLDWSRISPAAARRIVEEHGASLEVAEGPSTLELVITFPREREAGAQALSELEPAAASDHCSPLLEVAA